MGLIDFGLTGMYVSNANSEKSRIITALFWLLILAQSQLTLAYCPEVTVSFEEADRITALNEFLEQDLKLLNSIPRLSPREEDWLEQERSAGVGTRYQAALESREYAAHNTVKRLSFRIQLVRDIISHEAIGPIQLNYNLERYSNLVFQLLNNASHIGDSLIALSKHEVVIADPLQHNGAFVRRTVYESRCKIMAKNILLDVLQPALQQLPE